VLHAGILIEVRGTYRVADDLLTLERVMDQCSGYPQWRK